MKNAFFLDVMFVFETKTDVSDTFFKCGELWT